VQHSIKLHELPPQGEAMAKAVEACVHCGFCLPACPTYTVLGEEMDSPRGRIILMKEVLEGSLELEAALPYVDKCLGCVGCVTACPSGVQYGELITPFRALAEEKRDRTPLEKLTRAMALQTLPYPTRFRLAAMTGKLAKPFAGLLPSRLKAMLDLLPANLPAAQPLPEIIPARGTRRARVVLLSGCAQQVLAPGINAATIRVLSRNGVEVLIPRDQGCCGAIVMHAGEQDQARPLARQNLEVFTPMLEGGDVDAVVTNAAGCGSGMHEYSLLFKGQPEETKAAKLAQRTKDVSLFLTELGMIEPHALEKPLKLAYHDACHLSHAQGIRTPPRMLLSRIENLELLELHDLEVCCGSAGTYNIEQPEIANKLGTHKANAILETGASVVASGNIGCLTQISQHLEQRGSSIRVLHTFEVLDRAYSGLPI
jgi:glycolate oxidase iron-sulfur subunit